MDIHHTLSIYLLRQENNILLIKGAVPGSRNGLILVQGEGDLTVSKVESKKVESDDKNVETKQALSNKDEQKEETPKEEEK